MSLLSLRRNLGTIGTNVFITLQNSALLFSNILFVTPMPIICVEQTNTRLSTNCCALSSQWMLRHTPLFPYQNASLNKGIRAQQEKLTATKGAIVGTQARSDNTNTV
jgi:hypothetical protein